MFGFGEMLVSQSFRAPAKRTNSWCSKQEPLRARTCKTCKTDESKNGVCGEPSGVLAPIAYMHGEDIRRTVVRGGGDAHPPAPGYRENYGARSWCMEMPYGIRRAVVPDGHADATAAASWSSKNRETRFLSSYNSDCEGDLFIVRVHFYKMVFAIVSRVKETLALSAPSSSVLGP